MLERVVEARHLAELDRPVEILREPQLLEVRDVPEVPDDGTHQRIVLPVQILVRHRGYEQQRSSRASVRRSAIACFEGGAEEGVCVVRRDAVMEGKTRSGNKCNHTAVLQSCHQIRIARSASAPRRSTLLSHAF